MQEMIQNRLKAQMLCEKLQNQPQVPVWSIANESLLCSIVAKKPMKWGPRQHFAKKIVLLCYKLNISDFSLICFGFYYAMSIYFKSKKISQKINSYPIKIFAGFGASSEEHLFKEYVDHNDANVIRINYSNFHGVKYLTYPSFTKTLLTVYRLAIGHTKKLKNSIPELSENLIDFLTVCSKNIGEYSFYKEYAKKNKEKITEISTISVDISTFAFVDEHIKTIFIQHGLLAYGILFPKFHKAKILTYYEKKFLEKLLANSHIELTPIKNNAIFTYQKTIIILSPDLALEKRVVEMQPLIELLKKNGWNIVLRPTPHITKESTDRLLSLCRSMILDNIHDSLESSIQKWKPKLVAGWFSTGLATALNYGCLPINFYDPKFNVFKMSMIYPIEHKALFWPNDKSIIKNCIANEQHYQTQLKRLSELYKLF